MPAGERYLAPCPLHVTRAPFDQLFQHVAEQRVVAIEDPAGERLLARESLASRVLGHVPDFDHGRVMQIARPRCRVWIANFDYMNDTVLPEIREAMMKRWLIFIYGVACYAIGFVTLLYAIGFVGNLVVPKSIDSAPRVSLGLALLIDLIVLALFAIQHSVMARPAFKRWWTRIVPKSAERSTYLLFTSIALTVLFVFWEPLGGSVWDVRSAIGRGLLFGAFAFGWFLVFLSTFLINHFDLFGLRQIWLQLIGKPYKPLPFKTPMLYRIVRHPLYLGLVLAFWSTPTMTLTHLVFAIATTAYILIAIQLEENDLLAALPEYAQYRKRVPMLVPFLKRSA